MEPQTTTITIMFKTKHSPGTEQHLQQVLHNYLHTKGVDYSLRDNTLYL